MSLNQSFALRTGNDYSKSIDFQLNENFTQADYKDTNNKPCGELIIGGQSFNVSTRDVDRLIETLQSARDVIYKKHKLGLMIS